MKCFRSLVGESRMDRVWNQEVRRRAGVEKVLSSIVDHRGLRWSEHLHGNNG